MKGKKIFFIKISVQNERKKIFLQKKKKSFSVQNERKNGFFEKSLKVSKMIKNVKNHEKCQNRTYIVPIYTLPFTWLSPV